MPTPTVIGDLNTVIANNFPAGSNAPSVLDDVQRAHAAFIAQLRDRTAANWPNTPAGGVTESTVQGAIDGLDARKSTYHFSDIINGNFPVAQAGTSFAAPANGAYDLDGWFNENTSAAVFTVAQVAGSTAGRLARQVTITTADAAVAAGDLVTDATRIEGYNIEKYVGQTFTIAFRAKVPVAGVHCVALRNSGNDRSYVKEINFPTANVWQDCSFTVTGGLPTAGTWNYTNGVGLSVSFVRMSGATFQTTPDAWQTGNFVGTANQVNDCATVGNVCVMEKVTMNLGTVAAVSETSVEDELRRCLRQFWAVGGSTNTPFGSGVMLTATEPLVYLAFPNVMRAVPTFSYTLPTSPQQLTNGVSSNTTTTPTLSHISTSGANIDWAGSATQVAGQGVIVRANSSTSYLYFSARL